MPSDQKLAQRNRRPLTVAETFRQGQIAFRENNFDRAISLCRQVLDHTPDSASAIYLLAQSLRRSGGIGQEIDALRSAADSSKEAPGFYQKLGILQGVAGDRQDATASLERAAAINPRKVVIRVSLGIVHYENGDMRAAEREFMRVLEMDPRFAPAHYYLGSIYSGAKKWRKAGQSFSAALDIKANYPPACFGLASVLFDQAESKDRTGDLERAAGLVLRAIGNGVGDFGNYLLAGKILVELERYEEAVEILETAGNFDEKNSDFYVAISVAYWNLGKIAKARVVSRRQLREFPVGSRIGAKAEAEVLVLETLRYSVFRHALYGVRTYAHVNTIASLPSERVSLHHVFIESLNKDQQEFHRNKYDVIYNNAANAEVNSLQGYDKAVQTMSDYLGLPVVNPPGLVELTARDHNYQRLHKIDHLIFPKTIAVTPDGERAGEIIERVEAEFDFPVLVRLAGGHRATELAIADDIGALRDALTRFADGLCYVIQYHESKHPSGNFLMRRAVFVGGKFYPARMYLSDKWLVSGPQQRKLDQTPMEASGEFQDEEKRWQANPSDVIGEANMNALHALDDIVGLDCYGVDLGIAEDGRVIVFEANSCMNCLSIMRHIPKFPYLRPATNKIQTALEDLLIDRAHGRG